MTFGDSNLRGNAFTARHLQLGKIGEDLAATWMMEHGFRLLHRNWKLKGGVELDIVAFKDNLLHVVEVKTRSSDMYVDPMAAIDRQKLMRLYRGTFIYKKYYGMRFESVLDAIRIVYRNEHDFDLKFIPNIHQHFS